MNILTFDIEDWFHILDNASTKNEKQWNSHESRIEANVERIFKLLDDNNQKATFFCIGWVARKYPNIIKKIDSLGYEIATHSDMHQLAYEFNKKEFNADLEKSIKSIEDISGKKIITYRAPGFSVKENNLWVFDELVKHGIEIDCSIFPAKRSHGGLENFGAAKPTYIQANEGRIKEFPINVSTALGQNIIFSGGGYFRLFPYSAIKHFMNRSEYVMTYMHPRDFDANQPMIENLSLFRKFKSYYGLKDTYKKLEMLIQDFDFIDIAEADKLVDWENTRVVELKDMQ